MSITPCLCLTVWVEERSCLLLTKKSCGPVTKQHPKPTAVALTPFPRVGRLSWLRARGVAASSGLAQAVSRLTKGPLRPLLGIAALVLLAGSLLEFPHHPYDVSHDLSSHATFEYYAANHFQFGKQVCLNVGPYGYTYYGLVYNGYLNGQKLLLHNGSRLVLLLLIFWVGRRLPRPLLRCCWYGIFIVVLPIGADAVPCRYSVINEAYAYLGLYLAGLYLLQPRRDWRFYLASAALLLYVAFTGLSKNTCLVVAMAVAGTVTLQKLLERDYRTAAWAGLLFPLSLAGLWVMAWQRLANLPLFVKGVFVFSGGYTETAALDDSHLTLLLALGLGLLLLAGSVFNWLTQEQPVGRTMIEFFVSFVIWKHACVRADALHWPILFYAALFLAPVVFLVRIRGRAPETANSGPRLHLSGAALAGCVAGLVLAWAGLFTAIPGCNYRLGRLTRHWQDNLGWLLSPGEKTAQMASELEGRRQDAALPATKAEVGQARIDFFGYEPGYLLLNGLNYWPRPVPITFAAANEPLQEANAAFYRDPTTAPTYVLCKLGGLEVNDRMYPHDDARALRALLEEYHPVLLEQDALEEMLLLRRNEPARAPAPARPELIAELKPSLGEQVSLAPSNASPLWLEADLEYSWLGKARAFFYKPPSCSMALRQAAQPEVVEKKFVASMGRCGFLLSPFLGESRDLLRLYQPSEHSGEAGVVQSFTLRCDPGSRRFFRDHVTLRLYRAGEFGGGGNELPEALRQLPAEETCLREWLRSNPASRMAHYKLGKLLAAKGQPAEAVRHWREAIRLKPDWTELDNNLAWILATSPDAAIRDGNQAVALAERACHSEAIAPPPSGSQLPGLLDTLAAAYAEAGRFEEAAQTARQAVQLAASAGQREAAESFGARLRQYESRRAYRQ